VQVNLDASDLMQQAIGGQPLGKLLRRFHRANGVGTGGADADFEDVENAGGHRGVTV